MNNNNDYTTGKLLDFVYFTKNYRLTKLKDPQQINFIGKLGKDNVLYYWNIRRNYFQFFTKFCHNYIDNGNTKNYKFTKCPW